MGKQLRALITDVADGVRREGRRDLALRLDALRFSRPIEDDTLAKVLIEAILTPDDG